MLRRTVMLFMRFVLFMQLLFEAVKLIMLMLMLSQQWLLIVLVSLFRMLVHAVERRQCSGAVTL